MLLWPAYVTIRRIARREFSELYQHIHAYIHAHVHTCIHVCTYIHVCMYTHVCSYIIVCSHIYVHTYIHTFIHTYILQQVRHATLCCATSSLRASSCTRWTLRIHGIQCPWRCWVPGRTGRMAATLPRVFGAAACSTRRKRRCCACTRRSSGVLRPGLSEPRTRRCTTRTLTP